MFTHIYTYTRAQRTHCWDSIPGRHIPVWQIPVSPWKPSIRPGIVVPRLFQCILSVGAARGSARNGHQWQLRCRHKTNSVVAVWLCSLKSDYLCKTFWQVMCKNSLLYNVCYHSAQTDAHFRSHFNWMFPSVHRIAVGFNMFQCQSQAEQRSLHE